LLKQVKSAIAVFAILVPLGFDGRPVEMTLIMRELRPEDFVALSVGF